MIPVILSLGAGVQSTTLALMAAAGELDAMPYCAIFADTGWEPRPVYDHLNWLEGQLPFPILRTRRPGPSLGMLVQLTAAGEAKREAVPPWYTADPLGMLPQQCSKEFKTRVVAKEIRDHLGLRPRQRGPKTPAIELWLGISTDEASRMKPSEKKYLIHTYPLVDRKITRADCLAWMHQHGYPRPPKSACVFCPWTDRGRWREMQRDRPDDWFRAIEVDQAIRTPYPGMSGTAYVNRARTPLSDIDFGMDEPEADDQFTNDCSGLCGV
jgi:hypothetical protein